MQQLAAMLAFVEAFRVMEVVFLLMLPFMPLLQYTRQARAPEAVTEAAERETGGASLRSPESSPESPEPQPGGGEATAERDHLVYHCRVPSQIRLPPLTDGYEVCSEV